MATKFGFEPVVGNAFDQALYNSVAGPIASDADFAAQSALTGIQAASANLGTRPGGAEISSRFMAGGEVIADKFVRTAAARADHRAHATTVEVAPKVAAHFTPSKTPPRGGPASGPAS